MNNKKKCLIVLLVFSFILVSSYVLAAEENLLESIFSPLKGIDIAEFYEDYSAIIDFAVYVTLFVSLTQVAKPSHFDNKQGKSAMTVIGIILAISLSVFTRKIGFQLGNIGAFAFFVLLIFATVFIFRAFTKNSDISKRLAGSIAYMFVYLMIMMINKDFIEVIKGMHPLVYSMIQIGFVLSLVFIVMGIINFTKGKGTTTAEPSTITPPRDEKEFEKADKVNTRAGDTEQLLNERYGDELDKLNVLGTKKLGDAGTLFNQLIEAYNNGDTKEMVGKASALKNYMTNDVKRTIKEIGNKRRFIKRSLYREERWNRGETKAYKNMIVTTENSISHIEVANRNGQYNQTLRLMQQKRDVLKELEQLQGALIQSERGTIIDVVNRYADGLRRTDDSIDDFDSLIIGVIQDSIRGDKTGFASVQGVLLNNLTKAKDKIREIINNVTICKKLSEDINEDNNKNRSLRERKKDKTATLREINARLKSLNEGVRANFRGHPRSRIKGV